MWNESPSDPIGRSVNSLCLYSAANITTNSGPLVRDTSSRVEKEMSVLNQSGEEQVECPLCMESLEVDDLNFFPCTCGYQICRFCWHRIRTDENGLCPACRKAYPEDPADFKPLSKEELSRLKAEKRQKDQQRKQKTAENRKHLANVRVVQKNLVFVVGLPIRLADPEILKKHEYFGKFGKIHKVVINQSTSYAGSQGPSASAYVTYQRSDDALKAIQTVNNIAVDGRTVKTSLGTTKYCSHFMKNQSCPKGDCMYLHELGDNEASFTKEEMQQGKHQEYEKKLHEQLNSSTLNRKPTPSPPTVAAIKEGWPSLHQGSNVIVGCAPSSSPPDGNCNNKNDSNKKSDKPSSSSSKHKIGRNGSEEEKQNRDPPNGFTQQYQSSEPLDIPKVNVHPNHDPFSRSDDYEQENGYLRSDSVSENGIAETKEFPSFEVNPNYHLSMPPPRHAPPPAEMSFTENQITDRHKNPEFEPYVPENNSFFSQHTGFTNGTMPSNGVDWHSVNGVHHIAGDTLGGHVQLPPDTWQSAFNFSHPPEDETITNGLRDDDLGFDPFHETQKALAAMVEEEKERLYNRSKVVNHQNNRVNECSKILEGLRVGGGGAQLARPPPPGFTSTPNHMNAFGLGIPRTTGNKILPLAHANIAFPPPPVMNSVSAWDWTAMDPAILSVSNVRCELPGAPEPPPGFSSVRRTPLRDNL
ncbi:RNA recognition motif. (a.k.a. RRM, RBD, or RNP domain) [Nesidiocoris tenuis]|uniref:RNA recognition motif. (A.k.a. RRM, RBD, or RNP domain) n=1 Tax=Nesidiocoris tenuis TaxID=355587 RepID=A0ABN7B9I9_9HEMI|nr:RNA recognition motif. (a.k.a. RRM, RBD, or RNP domain) [Nesidiocoris tenuis]